MREWERDNEEGKNERYLDKNREKCCSKKRGGREKVKERETDEQIKERRKMKEEGGSGSLVEYYLLDSEILTADIAYSSCKIRQSWDGYSHFSSWRFLFVSCP